MKNKAKSKVDIYQTVINDIELIRQTIIMPRPQIRDGYSDTDSAVTENDECGEESEIPVATHVDEPCEESEGKTR